jgi:hypothetical protein
MMPKVRLDIFSVFCFPRSILDRMNKIFMIYMIQNLVNPVHLENPVKALPSLPYQCQQVI